MFILAFDPAFEYLLEDDEDYEDDEEVYNPWNTDTDILHDVNNFKIDVSNALDAYILNGAALARKVGSASYAVWTKAMIALSDLMNGVAEAEEADNTARVAVESVIEAQRQLWADVRCMRKCDVGFWVGACQSMHTSSEPCVNLKTAVGGEFFLTNLLFHPLGDVLLQVNLMHSSLYSQDSEHSLRSRPLCVFA